MCCWTNWVACSMSAVAAPGTVRRTIAAARDRLRVVDPVVQAAPSQSVVQIAAAVGGEHRDRRPLGDERPQFGHRDRRLAQELQQQRLEFVVGTVDLVDQQHRGSRAAVSDALQDRAVDKIFLGVQVGLVDPGGPRSLASASRMAEQLALVVPVVQRFGCGQALVALKAQQWCVQHGGKGFGSGRLANAGLALQQQRPTERDGQIDRRCGAEVEQVVLRIEAPDHLVDIGERTGHRRPAHASTPARSGPRSFLAAILTRDRLRSVMRPLSARRPGST